MNIRCLILLFPVLLFLLAGCASTGKDGAEKGKTPPSAKAEEQRKTESTWRKFMAKQEEEERRFHRMDSTQLDNFQVYPWREGDRRRSEKLHENRDKSVFTNGWW